MKSLQQLFDEQANENTASLRPAQLENLKQILDVARAYELGELTLEEAEYQTVGPYYRFKVTQTISPMSRDWHTWMKLIRDLCNNDQDGYWTNHGYFSKRELDFGSGRVRLRTKTDFINKTTCEIIETQYIDEGGKWQWPSEVPMVPQRRTTSTKPKDEAFVKKQWEAWEFPEKLE